MISRSGPSRRAIAFTVKSRRDRSTSIESPNDHLGLARIRPVGLGPVRRDLDGLSPLADTDGSPPFALQPDGVGPPGHDLLRLVRHGVGGEIDVGVERGLVAAEDVAYRTTHHVQVAAGVLEARGEVGGGIDQGLYARGNHRAEGSAHRGRPPTRATALTTSPGPP